MLASQIQRVLREILNCRMHLQVQKEDTNYLLDTGANVVG